MRSSDLDILVVPGLAGSGPDHWQSRWLAKLSTARRVQQADWDHPRREAWTRAVIEAVEAASRPVMLIAHSLGVPTLAHAAPLMPAGRVVGAFLVAPPSEAATLRLPAIDPAFRPYPRAPLPFPSLLVASRNDEYGSFDDAADLALAWGSALVDAGDAGHLNDASGHGPWPEGLMSFAGFLGRL